MAPDKKKLRKKLVGIIALCVGFRELGKRRRFREAHPCADPYISRTIKHYDELSLICGDDHATSSFARSMGQPSGTPTMRRQLSFGGLTSPFNDSMDNSQGSPNVAPSGSTSRSKRSGSKRCRSEASGRRYDPLVANLAEVVQQLVDPEWLDRLYTKLMEMHEFPSQLLEKAFDYLAAHKLEGSKFISRDREARYNWLEVYARDHPF